MGEQNGSQCDRHTIGPSRTVRCIKYLSLTTQTSVPKTTGTQSGNSSRCFENLVSSRVDEDKIILKDPGGSKAFDHFELLFGGIGSFTFVTHMKCKEMKCNFGNQLKRVRFLKSKKSPHVLTVM